MATYEFLPLNKPLKEIQQLASILAENQNQWK